MQQDAEEFWNGMMRALGTVQVEIGDEKKDLASQLFGIDLDITLKNQEVPDEPEVKQKDKSMKLSCFIDAGANPVNHLSEGVALSLTGEVEKFSEVAQRNCVYKREAKVDRLVSIQPNLSLNTSVFTLSAFSGRKQLKVQERPQLKLKFFVMCLSPKCLTSMSSVLMNLRRVWTVEESTRRN